MIIISIEIIIGYRLVVFITLTTFDDVMFSLSLHIVLDISN